jgi:rhodanese-related sulfurtransferase
MKKISFIGSDIVKEGFWIVLAGTILGVVVNHKLIGESMNGKLFPQIEKEQMNELKANADQIPFIELKVAKKLFNQKAAIFVDSRSAIDYSESHIQDAQSLSLISFIADPQLADEILPDRTALYIIYCSGGGCDMSVELAKELISHGYSNVEVLGEGYPGWFDAGYPVESMNSKR